MKVTYKKKVFFYFAIIFSAFTIGIIMFEQTREKRFKTEMLEEKLNVYSDILNLTLKGENPENNNKLDTIIELLPQNLRISIIDLNGVVLFDNLIKNTKALNNHIKRPEIISALNSGKGVDIRKSISNNNKYLYYAKKYGNCIIRVSYPYDIKIQRFMKSDNVFILFIITFFIFILFLINMVANRFAKSINELHCFVANYDKNDKALYSFPNDELGEIGAKIAENFKQLKETKNKIAVEREKLLQHVHSSEEGICFFDNNKKVEFYNGLFISYLNTITDESSSNPSVIFDDEIFIDIAKFLIEKPSNYFETNISKQGKIFLLRTNIFDDNSFEITMNDITNQEKARQLKYEMTGNIAHELRTPLTSIRGFLETLINQNLSDEIKDNFINKAYSQTIVLSNLVQDMSLITKIEELPQSFKITDVNINEIVRNLKNDFDNQLKLKNIKLIVNINNDIYLKGNQSLIYSIFRNLIDNAVKYAGENISIVISKINEDDNNVFFSFYDTGIGIKDEKHLNRLFERFYRIDEGRIRDNRGSGIGLSIVKNAVAFHKGTIHVKNRKNGGLEFLFNLKK